MPATNGTFGEKTAAKDVASYFEPQVKGKIILFTGTNLKGIGGATVLALASSSPKVLILTGRSPDKLEETAKAIRNLNPQVLVKLVNLDLGSQESCKAAAHEILNDPEIPQIDIVINNAGILTSTDRVLTLEGIELQFATNHLGHFTLTNGIMPKVLNSAEHSPKGSTRIVNISSVDTQSSPVRFSDINIEKKSSELPEAERPNWEPLNATGTFEDGAHTGRLGYAQSKTANILFSIELNKRLFEKHGILSLALHPGAISTELPRELGPERLAKFVEYLKSIGLYFKTLSEGASTTLVAALDPGLSPSEIYLSDCQVAEAPKWSVDPTAAERLWRLSEDYVGQSFAY